MLDMPNSRDLEDVLWRRLPAGKVTTYSMVSLWGYDVPTKNQPVGSMLRGMRNRGLIELTNRVVSEYGTLVNLPDGPCQQRTQLENEGIPFTDDGRVDFNRIDPVDLRDG